MGWDESNDRTIPHQLFLLFSDCIPILSAGQEVRMTHSVARGYGLARNGDNTQLQTAMRHLIQQAYPERYD